MDNLQPYDIRPLPPGTPGPLVGGTGAARPLRGRAPQWGVTGITASVALLLRAMPLSDNAAAGTDHG